jgi:hypothetical protein
MNNGGVEHTIELLVTPAMRELHARRKKAVRMMGEDWRAAHAERPNLKK